MSRSRRRPIAPCLAVLMAVLGFASTDAAARDVTVAVLYFDYDGPSEEMAFLRKGLGQMLVTDLVGTPGVTVVERARLEEVLAELDLNKTNKIDRTSALKVGKLLGARYLVIGGYFVFKDMLTVNVRMADVQTGAIISGVTKRRKFDEFYELEQALAGELVRILGEKVVPGASKGSDHARSPRPRKDTAARKGTGVGGNARTDRRKRAKVDARTAARYGKALDAVDRGDKKLARAELEAIVKQQPDFEMAALDLASLAQ